MIAEDIKANTAKWTRQEISFSSFSRENLRLWDLVSQREPRIAGTRCDARHMMMDAALILVDQGVAA